MNYTLPETDAPTTVLDAFSRPLRSLRISVTDRCNLRCQYCMPEEDYVWLPHREILTFEELAEIVQAFTAVGVDKIRLTGGEPLLRRSLEQLIRTLATNSRIRDLALTTNGTLLAGRARSLREAGLHRLTVSLDTLRPDRFRLLTRRATLAEVLRGISAAREAGFTELKINTVVIREFNDDELPSLIEFGREHDAEIRFIEYMDVGGATRWSMDQVVSSRAVLALLEERFGRIVPHLPVGKPNGLARGSAPAERYALPDGTVFGVISSTTQPFCGTCDRARLTTDGVWFLCLYAQEGVDLKRLLRGGAAREEIAAKITDVWTGRRDRGAEERQTLASRSVFVSLEELKKDPHREMHTRGG